MPTHKKGKENNYGRIMHTLLHKIDNDNDNHIFFVFYVYIQNFF